MQVKRMIIRSAGRNLVFVESAAHMFTPNREAEQIPGQFGDTVKTLFEYVDCWISQNGRFTTGAKAD